MFGWLKRKKEGYKGKANEELPIENKIFDVLNRVPLDYRYTIGYAEFLRNADRDIEKMMSKMKLDRYCAEAFDEYMGAFRRQMKAYAKEEYTHRMYVIEHNRGLLSGEVCRTSALKEKLAAELKKEEETLAKLENLKKERNMV